MNILEFFQVFKTYVIVSNNLQLTSSGVESNSKEFFCKTVNIELFLSMEDSSLIFLLEAN